MNTKLVIFALASMLAGSLLSIIFTLANAQLESCGYGYYLASNNMCYRYSQQQLQQLLANSTASPSPSPSSTATNMHTFGSGNCGGWTQVSLSGSILCAPGQDYKNCVVAAGNDETASNKCMVGIR